MRIPTYRFDKDKTIWLLFDAHIGDDACDRALFKRFVRTVADSDDNVIGGGDIHNCGLPSSKTDYTKSLPYGEEKVVVRNELEPIRDRFLTLVTGNHEERIQRAVGDDPTNELANWLSPQTASKDPKGRNDIYLGHFGVICVVCGRCAYYIAIHHGTGNGTTDGAKLNSLVELSNLMPGCDVYTEGHSHKHIYEPTEIPYLDKKRNLISYQQAHYISGSSFLIWEKSYALSKKWKPKPRGIVKITLYANNNGNSTNKKVDVSLFS